MIGNVNSTNVAGNTLLVSFDIINMFLRIDKKSCLNAVNSALSTLTPTYTPPIFPQGCVSSMFKRNQSCKES